MADMNVFIYPNTSADDQIAETAKGYVEEAYGQIVSDTQINSFDATIRRDYPNHSSDLRSAFNAMPGWLDDMGYNEVGCHLIIDNDFRGGIANAGGTQNAFVDRRYAATSERMAAIVMEPMHTFVDSTIPAVDDMIGPDNGGSAGDHEHELGQVFEDGDVSPMLSTSYASRGLNNEGDCRSSAEPQQDVNVLSRCTKDAFEITWEERTGGGGGNEQPSASASVSPSDPDVGQTVDFDGTGSSDPDGSISSYEWDFGDGASASGATVSHTYDDTGDYTATLTVTDDDGATSSDSVSVNVGDGGGGDGTVEVLDYVDIGGQVMEAVSGDNGDYAYVADGSGFASVDTSDPNNLSVLTNEDAGLSSVKDVKVDGNNLIVTSDSNGFALYDVSDPANPTKEATESTGFSIHNGFVDGNTVYVIDNGSTSMVTYDISGGTVSRLGEYSGPSARSLHDLYVQNDVAYLAFWNAGTDIVDVSDPANPSRISMARTDGNNDHYVQPDDDASHLLIGMEQLGSTDLGVDIYDISDPQNSQFLSTIEAPTGAPGEATSHNCDWDGDYIFSSWYTGGVRVHDVSDPSNPTEVDSWSGDGTSFWAATVAKPGEFFIASDESYSDGNGRLYAFSDPRGDGGGNEEPVASANASPTDPTVGESVQFDGSASSDGDGSITSYEWDFGDGTSGSGEIVHHSYDSEGQFTATLTVTDDDGASSSDTLTITVGDGGENQPPVASANASPTDPTVGDTVQFDGSGSSDPDGSIQSYEWDFGDGATGSGDMVSHSYDSAGEYTATLTVTDDDGATASDSVTVAVEDGGGDQAPVINTHTFSSDCGYWTCDYTVTVDISDADGDLASIESKLISNRGMVIDIFSTSLSGSGASGSFTLNGSYFYDADKIETTVTDENGNTDTAVID